MLAKEHVKTDELSDELGSTRQARRRLHDPLRQPGLGFRCTVLYRVVWSGFPADRWYEREPAENLGTDLVAAFGRGGRDGAGCGRGQGGG